MAAVLAREGAKGAGADAAGSVGPASSAMALRGLLDLASCDRAIRWAATVKPISSLNIAAPRADDKQ